MAETPVRRHARPLLGPAGPEPVLRVAPARLEAPHPGRHRGHPGAALLGRRVRRRDPLRERHEVGPCPGGPGHRGPGRGDEVAPGVRRSAGPSAWHRGRGAPASRTDAQAVIERHMAYPNVRGVRDFGPGDYLVDDVVAAWLRPPRASTTWWPASTRRPRRTPRCAPSRRRSPTSSSRSTMPASRASATPSTSRCGSGSSRTSRARPT